MSPREVREWVDGNLSRKQAEFGLSQWEIVVEYVNEDDYTARITCLPEYERALLAICERTFGDANLDPVSIEKVIEHELLHVVHASLDDERAVLGKMLTDSEYDVYREIALKTHERIALQMERTVAAIRSTERARVSERDSQATDGASHADSRA